MSRAGRGHDRYRELISARLDGDLPPLLGEELTHHLARCGRCRATEAAYRAQRRQLRALGTRPVTPPRDMWARTSAALDREIARHGDATRAHGRQALFGGAVVASVALIGVAISLLSTQLPPATPSPAAPATGAQAVRPTPFTVPPEALAFVGSGIEGLAVYRTRVDRVCPAAAIDCVDSRATTPALVRLPRTLQPSNLALSPNGGVLAIQARRSGGEDVVAVVQMPEDELLRQPGRSGRPSSGASPSAGTSTQASPAPTDRTSPAAAPSGTPLTEGPSASATLPVPPIATPTGALAPGDPDFPFESPTEMPAEAVLPILEDVRTVGAPAAWSSDGSALAFSAMPADASHGPDVYLWRPGDERAQPLTDDHASYFASWAGSRVVISRVSGDEASDGPGADPVVDTVVIDVDSGEARMSEAGHGLWLPDVDPLESLVVAWQGELAWLGRHVQAGSGNLYVARWSDLDPFTAATGAGDTDVMVAPAGLADAQAAASAAADEHGSEGSDDPAADGRATSPPDAGVDATERPREVGRGLGLVPLESQRDPTTDPVRDWQVRWSADGDVLAYWIADAPGASWGQLAVVAVDASTGTLADEAPLLAPSLARRAFTLGSNRIAWVAPADGEVPGELRIRTWGPGGFGGLRLRPHPLGEVVPAS